MSISDLKFTEEQIAAKSITALADRPELSAAELKERLDSCDIRNAFNGLVDEAAVELEKAEQHRNQLIVFETTRLLDAISVMQQLGTTQRFFAFFLDTGKTFCGNSVDLQMAIINNKL